MKRLPVDVIGKFWALVCMAFEVNILSGEHIHVLVLLKELLEQSILVALEL